MQTLTYRNDMPLYLLDTDHCSLLQRGNSNVIARYEETSDDELAVSVVGYEEQFRGWQGLINRAKNSEHLLLAYQSLQETKEFYCGFRMLDFDEKANEFYLDLRQKYRRNGTMDLRIAATALASNAILVTRNTQDFAEIENLKIENWA
jgi:tRNA(fMet)-specific endonuclease VapC